MLQQILQDMWVDPHILAELDEDQKQTLFCRMREEQVRRWMAWDQQEEETPHTRTSDKQVGFMLGADGEPWVWVMGEHPNDQTIDQILEKEAREKARRLAELETEHIRKKMEAELSQLLDLNAQQMKALEEAHHMKDDDKKEAIDIYCSVDDLMQRPNDKPHISFASMHLLDVEDRKLKSVNKRSKVAQRVALWETKVMEERTSEIFRSLQDKKAAVEREAEEAESKQELMWQEQERRAKEAELQIREIARRAREEHRRMSVLDASPQLPSSPTRSSGASTSGEDAPSTPLSREAVVQWYRCSEVPRGAGICLDTHTIQPWFHGLISRQKAESLLEEQVVGTFLVRVSERIWGYAISYRDADRCKHYLIDASTGHYQFLGSNHLIHDSLAVVFSTDGEVGLVQCQDVMWMAIRKCPSHCQHPPHFPLVKIWDGLAGELQSYLKT